MLALTCCALAVPAAFVLWIICGVLADKAADAEWRQIDRAWFASGRDVLDALSKEVRARHDATERPTIIRLGA